MRIILLLIIFSTLLGCSQKSNKGIDENRLERLDRMRVYNSPSVFYDYSYGGLMAWSSSIIGRVFIDSTDVFSWEKAQNKFPLGYIAKIDFDSNQIDMIQFITDSSEIINNGIYTKEYEHTKINIKQYYNTRGSTMGFFYHFHNLSETKDSIYFDRIYKKDYDFGLDFKDKIGFRKGNIFVEEDSLGYVSKIKFTLINRNTFWKDLTHKDSITVPKPFNGINEINLPPLSEVYMFQMELRPDSLSLNQRISDYGVYKKVK